MKNKHLFHGLVRHSAVLLGLWPLFSLPAETPQENRPRIAQELPARAVYAPAFNSWFFLSEQRMTWTEGKAYAERFGGHLAVIESAEENNWIHQLSPGAAWIGLHRETSASSTWVWMNGAPFVYENWETGEPNNRQGNEDYAHYLDNGKWNDHLNDYDLFALVEVPAAEGGQALPARAVYAPVFNSWFFLSGQKMTWTEGKACAERFGGHLAVIESAEENSWLHQHFPGEAWIGLHRAPPSSSTWVWVNGAPFVYENWETGEPNNHQGYNEDYAHYWDNGTWNDNRNHHDLFALVEVPAAESVASSSFSAWLNSFGLAADDLAANGDPLLIAYALNLNPTNSAAFLPLPSVESGTFRLDFPVDRSDVLVGLERSTDLTSSVWESVGVTTNSGTASVSIPLVGSESPEKLYLRFTAQEE